MATNKTEEAGLASASYRENNKSLVASSTDTPQTIQSFDHAATKRLLRKLDYHLIPFLALIYLSVASRPFILYLLIAIYSLCFLDRTNVGNARLVKLEVDLGMQGLDYNIA